MPEYISWQAEANEAASHFERFLMSRLSSSVQVVEQVLLWISRWACTMHRKLFAVLVLLALASCRHDFAPAVSGTAVDGGILLGQFTLQRPSVQPETWELTDVQVKRVSAWLAARSGDLSMILASPPPPRFSIILKHADGTRTQIDLFDINESWKGGVHIYRTHSSENGSLGITAEERKTLLEMVAKGNHAG